MSTTCKPNTVVNGGYQTSSGTVSTVTLTGAGSSNSVLNNGAGITGAVTWAQPNSHFDNGTGQTIMTIPHGKDKIIIEDRAELEVKGRVKINGLDLEERLKTIEKVLAIPERDVILESKHPRLKELYDEYIHALAKYRTWDALNDE